MITSFSVENLKKFQHLELKDLKRINIISGQNNTGKTSILEALFMFYDRSSPELTLKQYAWRGVNTINFQPSSLWQPLFNDFNLENKIKIKVKDNQASEEAVYEHVNNFNATISRTNQQFDPSQIFSSNNALTESLKITYKSGKRNAGEANLFIQSGQLSLNVKNLNETPKQAVFVGSSSKGNTLEDAERLGRIDIEVGLDEITNYLRVLEPKLKSLSIVPHAQQPLIYGDIGLSRKIPISYMGEGPLCQDSCPGY
ncbi:AAA family ATPase [Endozoicomonas sp. 4G]|uniref:AAA family ATPase n=1 Tax=Endozoicomonas sp. 4G TaxID=2872754 RepID=UPI002078FA4F|nr:AAA family ATPase [Endozoicomonas sp. 4G]